MTALIDVTLPALDEPECVVETAAGRLRVPGRRLPARTVSLDAELAKRLVMAAREAASRAHAPYSNFHVGAAVIMADDPEQRILTGSNIENASFGATVCGERNALHHAAAHGFRRLKLLGLSTADSLGADLSGRSPCGICRQVISEFAADAGDENTLILIDTVEEDVLCDVLDVDRLLPWRFALGA